MRGGGERQREREDLLERLSPDAGCRRGLLWRLRLRSIDVRALADRLRAGGWCERTNVPQVIELEGPRGHGAVFVPRTGRIQLRISYLTPHAQRSAEAQALADQLEARVARS